MVHLLRTNIIFLIKWINITKNVVGFKRIRKTSTGT
jgi:hypothetical protein